MADKKLSHEERRRMLIDATSAMLKEKGIRHITMRALSGRVGISRGAPYRHFDDKRALLAAVAEDGFDRLRGRLEDLADSGQGVPSERLQAAGAAYVEFALDNPALYRLMFNVEIARAPSAPGLVDSAISVFSAFRSLVRQHLEDEKITPETIADRANVAWATFHGLSMLLIHQLALTAGRERYIDSQRVVGSISSPDTVNRLVDTALDSLACGLRT